jgi:hypothetical protein
MATSTYYGSAMGNARVITGEVRFVDRKLGFSTCTHVMHSQSIYFLFVQMQFSMPCVDGGATHGPWAFDNLP